MGEGSSPSYLLIFFALLSYRCRQPLKLSLFLSACTLGMTKPLQAADLPSRLLLDSVVCLLRTLVVGVAMHCHALSSRLTHSVASLLLHLVKFGARKGGNNMYSFLCLLHVHPFCLYTFIPIRTMYMYNLYLIYELFPDLILHIYVFLLYNFILVST